MAFSKQEALSLIKKALEEDRLGHAYLLCGSSQEEIGVFSEELASLILGCSLLHLQEHPDFHSVEPESKARKILTNQMRQLEEALHLKAQASSYKVAVIHDADRMVPAAANAFLKTLEEPPDKTVLLLVTLLPETILETIRSRCLLIALHERDLSPESEVEKKVKSIMCDFFKEDTPKDATTAFQCTRAFQELLSMARTEALEAAQEEFQAEKKQYTKTTDGSWEEAREDHFKAIAEAAALESRSLLLAGVANYFGASLREVYQQKNSEIHQKAASLLRALEIVESLRHSLEQGVHEALALETGFLELTRIFHTEAS
jgi:DNA polymerase-3 subunit delta'